jgi:hypothetical protein
MPRHEKARYNIIQQKSERPMEKEMVFISWSGPRGKAIAQALYDWLPRIIQAVDPWMSQHDIHKGTRWSLELARGLEEARFGLCCLTPENLNKPWILFEAGAIAKAVEEAYVWTYLFDLEYTDIKGPLAQFNHTKANEDDTRRLVRSINKAMGDAIRQSDFDETFTKWYPDLEQRLKDIPPPPPNEEAKPKRSQEDMLEEILLTVRSLARPGRLYIHSAIYGTKDRIVDVTDILRSAVSISGRLKMTVSNDELGGDPVRGAVKELKVVYSYAGETFSRTFLEGEGLSLP